MNDRIHELGKQAAAETSKEVVYLNNIHEWQLVFEQKFAELIVRECARSVTWYTKEERNWPNKGQVLRANKTVLEHFGVEE
jgi:hypothetical protein